MLLAATVATPADAFRSGGRGGGDDCEDLANQIESANNRLIEIERRGGTVTDADGNVLMNYHGDARTVGYRLAVERQRLSEQVGNRNAFRVLLADPTRNTTGIAARLAETERVIARLSRLVDGLDAAVDRLIQLDLDVRALYLIYIEAGCDDDDGPPSSPQPSPGPQTDPRCASPGTNRRPRRRDVSTLATQLLQSLPGLPAQLATVRPDGTLVDSSGQFVFNAANPSTTLQVPIGGDSPFRADQRVTVNYSQFQFAGDSARIVASFTDANGRPISAAGTSPPSLTGGWLSSLWLVTAARTPSSSTSGTTTVLPVFGAAVGVTAAVTSILARRATFALQLLWISVQANLHSRPWRGANPEQARRGNQTSPCGFYTRFSNRGLEYVATNCGRTPSSGVWTVRVASVEQGTSKGLSFKFDERLTRDGRWHQIANAKVWNHSVTEAEFAVMTEQAASLWREVSNRGTLEAAARLNSWQARLVPSTNPAKLGGIAWRTQGISGSTATTYRSDLRKGCNQPPPTGYQERNIPG